MCLTLKFQEINMSIEQSKSLKAKESSEQIEYSLKALESKQVRESNTPLPHDELLTSTEACTALKCGLTRLYQFINSGQLKSVKMGKSRRIPRSAINDFIASLMEK